MIPTPEYFIAMWQYVIWADLQQLQVADTLSDEEYFKPRGFSFGNVHGMLLHQTSAHRAWLNRFEKQPPVWLADEPRMKERSAIRTELESVHAGFADFMARQTDVTLHADFYFKSRMGFESTQPLGKLLIHLINHAMQHRGQLNSMMQLAGAKPPTVDYSYYINLK